MVSYECCWRAIDWDLGAIGCARGHMRLKSFFRSLEGVVCVREVGGWLGVVRRDWGMDIGDCDYN